MLILCLLFFLNQILVLFNQKKGAFVLLLVNLLFFAILFYSHARFPLFVRL